MPNGTIIRLGTKNPFKETGISSFINKHGWYYITVAGAMVDTVALDDAKKYSLERYAFGKPIGSFQALKHKMADMYVIIEFL